MAWETEVGPVCVMTHETPSALIELTHDPAQPEYTISILRKTEPWPVSPTFTITFFGLGDFTISTDRHVLSDGGRRLTVTAPGFGNVIRGIAAGDTARAMTGNAFEDLPLADAGPAVRAYAECAPVAGV